MSVKGDKQRKRVLDYIIAYMLENGYAPTLREICEELDMSLSSVYNDVRTMVDNGKIAKYEGARAICIPGYKIVKV